MSDPEPPLDELRIIEALDRHGVEYVLVGGLAARLQGATRVTRDFDACPSWDKENLRRLAAVLRELDARLRDFPPELVFPIDSDSLNRMEIGTWRTSAGDLDVLIGIPTGNPKELNRYDTLRARAAPREIAGRIVYVAHLDDIITSKEVAGRAKDREALPELRAMRAAALAGAAYPEGIEGALAEGGPPPPEEPSSPDLGQSYRQEPPGRWSGSRAEHQRRGGGGGDEGRKDR